MSAEIVSDTPAAAPAAAPHKYEFNITMSCTGCSGAVERVLKKMDGIQSFDVSLADQSATVFANPAVEYSAVLEKIKKTGKAVTSGKADGVEMAV